MYGLTNFAQAAATGNQVITTADATSLFTAIIGFVTANIGAILVLVGSMIGLVMVTRMINGAGKGKGKVKV